MNVICLTTKKPTRLLRGTFDDRILPNRRLKNKSSIGETTPFFNNTFSRSGRSRETRAVYVLRAFDIPQKFSRSVHALFLFLFFSLNFIQVLCEVSFVSRNCSRQDLKNMAKNGFQITFNLRRDRIRMERFYDLSFLRDPFTR